MRDKREGTPTCNFCEGHHTEGNKDTDRHYRMLSFINPIIKIFKQKHWLTAGDGLGREAIFLKKQSVKKLLVAIYGFLLLINRKYQRK